MASSQGNSGRYQRPPWTIHRVHQGGHLTLVRDRGGEGYERPADALVAARELRSTLYSLAYDHALGSTTIPGSGGAWMSRRVSVLTELRSQVEELSNDRPCRITIRCVSPEKGGHRYRVQFELLQHRSVWWIVIALHHVRRSILIGSGTTAKEAALRFIGSLQNQDKHSVVVRTTSRTPPLYVAEMVIGGCIVRSDGADGNATEAGYRERRDARRAAERFADLLDRLNRDHVLTDVKDPVQVRRL